MDLRTEEPADIETGHRTHALGVALVAFREDHSDSLTYFHRVCELLCLREPGVLIQQTATKALRSIYRGMDSNVRGQIGARGGWAEDLE